MHPFDELTKMNQKELALELEKSKADLFKLKLSVATRQTKETSKLKGLRKYVARIKTLQKQLAFEKAPENATSPVTK